MGDFVKGVNYPVKHKEKSKKIGSFFKDAD